jgi:P-type Mg2+ transporter
MTIQRTHAQTKASQHTKELLSLTPQQALSQLNSTENGLTAEEASRRLNEYGPNEFVKTRKRTGLIQFLTQFKNPLVIILLIAGAVSLALGEAQHVIIIYLIVLISTYLTYYQESKAEKAAELLKEKVSTTATLIRDGKRGEVKLHDVVPGDVIFLSAGDIVPADARVLSAKDLFLNQSALTGESFPVEKIESPLENPGDSITEWKNYLFMGTPVISGTATAVVVATGGATEYGEIAKILNQTPPPTEFEKGLRSFGLLIMQATLILVIVVFALNAYNRGNILEALLFSVALAVGLTPELLPMITSLNLTKGAMAMSRRGAIVKRLSSIQNFGSMDVLCTDKTGTLTQNKTQVIRHIDIDGGNSEKVILLSYLNSLYQTGLKSPLDEAILGFKVEDASGYTKVDEIPFDFVRRRVSVVVDFNGSRLLVVKGAPEEILKVSNFCEHDGKILDLTENFASRINRTFGELSAEGFRVLGVAYKELKVEKQVYSVNDESHMVYLGFVAFLDPPKESARESIRLLSSAGVELKVVTGDNEVVTRMVCESVGMEIHGVLLGSEMANMTDDALIAAAGTVNVFARVSPVQKERIISILREDGHVVGYLGDGINDAPSLRAADVGISVNNAVDVAKESADIILLENDLTILEEGVLEGRKTFGNTMKYVMMGTSSNFGNMFSVAGGSLFLPFLPMTALQILLNNLLYDLSQTTISTDHVDREYIEKPKKWDITYIRNFMIALGPISSIFDFATFFIMLLFFNASASLFQTAWFIESLTTQTLVIFSIRTRMVPFWRSRPSRPLIMSCFLIIAVGWVLPLTPLSGYFGFVAPPFLFYPILVGLVGIYFVLVELAKVGFYKRNAHRIEGRSKPRPKFFLGDDQRLFYNMVAVLAMYPGEMISVRELLNVLKGSVDFHFQDWQVGKYLITLDRGHLVTHDHDMGTIRAGATLPDFLNKALKEPYGVLVSKDVLKIREAVIQRYGSARLV